jgi:ADP-ribose pyrophosphatase
MQPWKTLSRQTILEHSKYLTVEEHIVELPDGQVIEHWPWIITPDFVNVVAITAENEFLCFRQTKYGVDGTSLAVVGGYIDPGEEPLEAAKRELLEETGHEAAEWIELGSYRVGASRGIAMAHFYLARGSRQVAAPIADDLEEQILLHLSHTEVEAALLQGEFQVLPWAASVALALHHLAKS